MQRRGFLALAAGGMAGLPGLAGASPARSATGIAAARIGRRIRATLSGPELQRLRAVPLPAPAALAQPLAQMVAADHRAGRIVRVQGISLAQAEAAWCLACAEGRAGS